MERTESMTRASAPARPAPGTYIDWAAIIAGAVVASAIVGLFTAFGAALGLSAVSPEPGEGSFDFWVILTAVWVVIMLVVSYLAGGYVAGRMRRRLDDADADEVATRDGINGLVVWGLGMLVTAWMAAGAIGGLASAVGTTAEAVGSAVGGVAQGAGSTLGNTTDGSGVLDYMNSAMMRPALTGTAETEGEAAPDAPSASDVDLVRQTGIVLGDVLRNGEVSDADREFLVAAVARRSGLGEAEVEARVDEAVTWAQETRQAAIDAAETARIAAILSAFLLTAAALVAGAAAVIGAVRGGRHRDEGRIFAGLSYRL